MQMNSAATIKNIMFLILFSIIMQKVMNHQENNP